MYLFELLDEERRLADKLKALQEAKQSIERMIVIGYPGESIRRYCRKVSGFDNLDEAISEAKEKIVVIQEKIRKFM